jgi:hypothetical protein
MHRHIQWQVYVVLVEDKQRLLHQHSPFIDGQIPCTAQEIRQQTEVPSCCLTGSATASRKKRASGGIPPCPVVSSGIRFSLSTVLPYGPPVADECHLARGSPR